MSKKQKLWWRIKEAPIGREVLIWTPPNPFPGDAAKMLVAAARTIDPRSGRVVQNFTDACRWTELPRSPFQIAPILRSK